jgi:hypothetical protein
MGYAGPWRSGSGLAAVTSTVTQNGATQVNSQQQNAAGGGSARIINTSALPVWVCFFNWVANGSAAPTVVFPTSGTPQPTAANIPAGPSVYVLVAPALSGGPPSVAYVDGVGGCDSYATISLATAAGALYVQKGEGTGPG